MSRTTNKNSDSNRNAEVENESRLESKEKSPEQRLGYAKHNTPLTHGLMKKTALSSRNLTMAPFITAMLNTRAVGYYTTVVGGAASTMEPIAEQIVKNNLELELSSVLMNGTLLHEIGKKLLPNSDRARFESGKITFAHPMISKVVKDQLTANGHMNASGVVLAAVITEMFIMTLAPLGIVLPFKGGLFLSEETTVIPTLEDLHEAVKVRTLTDILEAARFDPQLSRVKTISATAMMNAAVPMFNMVGRTIREQLAYQPAFLDTFMQLRAFILKDTEHLLHPSLINNSDLREMASNFTLASAALSMQPTVIWEADLGMLREGIKRTVSTLRELKHFKTISLLEFRQMYSHEVLHDSTGQQVNGVVFTRNLVPDLRVQITEMVQVGDSVNQFWEQVPARLAESQMENVIAPILKDALSTQTILTRFADVATYITRSFPTAYYLNNITAAELSHYAAGYADAITISVVDLESATEENLTPNLISYEFVYVTSTSELNFDSQAIILGNQVNTSSPEELIVFAAPRSFSGDASVPTRIQSIPETDRDKLFLSSPSALLVSGNELFSRLDRPVSISLTLGSQQLTTRVSLQRLLGLNPHIKMAITTPIVARIMGESAINALLDIDSSFVGTYGTIEAQQIGDMADLKRAMAINEYLRPIYESHGCRQLAFILGREFVAEVGFIELKSERDELRGHLRHAEITHSLLTWSALLTLARCGAIHFEVIERVIELFNRTRLTTFLIGSPGIVAFDNLLKQPD